MLVILAENNNQHSSYKKAGSFSISSLSKWKISQLVCIQK